MTRVRACTEQPAQKHQAIQPPTPSRTLPLRPQVKAYEEQVLSVALHPTGFMLLAGFADRLRLMTVLAGGPPLDLRIGTAWG